MENFAAAAMMRLIQAGLKAAGIEPPAVGPADGAHVSLDAKRDLLRWVVETQGYGCIFRFGESVPTLTREPALTALLVARNPVDLLERWQRMERYLHSRHRVSWQWAGEGEFLLTHASTRGEAPRLEETLLVAGLLTRLIDLTGGKDATAADPAIGRNLCDPQSWKEGCPALGGGQVAIRFLLEGDPADRARPQGQISDGMLEPHLRRLIEEDPCRSWTLSDAASACGVGPRSLQRHLARSGVSFSRILRDARVASAADLLCRTNDGLSEIGFVCGFSDQAHFTRQFKRAMAVTPLAYRRDFAVDRGV